jgi:simple sugar transport system permease protein
MTTVAIERSTAKNETFGRALRRTLTDSPALGPLITLAIVLGLSALFIPNFATLRTVSGILNSATVVGIVTIGITLLMISGEFDLSVGAMLAAGSYLFAFNTINGGSPIVAILLALLVPGILGTINGLLRVSTGIPSFVVTLGTQSIFRAAVWIIAAGELIQTQVEFPIYDILNGRLDIVNNLFERANFRTSLLLLLLLVFIFEVLLMRSRFGNHIFATGGNPGAATAQGVNIKWTRILVFTLVGMLAGFAGVLDFSQFRSVRVATGAGVELSAIAAAVIGGARLQGGSGSIWGALIGVILVSTLRTSAILLGLPADNFESIVGVCIIGAVVLNNWMRQKFG